MGKRIIQQARGKGSLTYRVRRKAYSHKLSLPTTNDKEFEIVELLHSAGHNAPLMKIVGQSNKAFYLPAFEGAYVGQKIKVGGEEVGSIVSVGAVPVGSEVYNVELKPNDGGKVMRSGGCAAIVAKKLENGKIALQMPSKKEVVLSPECRAILGRAAGDGRVEKPFVTAGRKFYKMKARNKLWPRTSAVKVNAVDHPFGSGRGKRIKPKIAKRNAPPGQKVGHLRPRRTGKRK
ncbi:50S ribosomal protein L2 [Candidatus Pacearchaeota archaeon]|nr:MAG: 50S ribosomal protein L2 [Candidatus Pacearchaeota archaeon]